MNIQSHEITMLLKELESAEQRVWKALARGDKQADDDALHADFLGVYSDGFATKTDHIQQLDNGPTIESYKLSELRALPLGRDYAMLTYRADFLRKERDEAEAMFVSSIWQRDGTRWINVFSQDTVAIPPLAS